MKIILQKSFSLMVIFFAFIPILPCDSSADVTNMSSYPIFVKPEYSSIPIKVNPGKTYKGRNDGIIVPSQKPGKVYKTVDNTDATVDKDGEIHSSSHDIQGALGQFFIGGWIDKISPRLRREWQKSFDKSNEVEKQKMLEKEMSAAKTEREKILNHKERVRIDKSNAINDMN